LEIATLEGLLTLEDWLTLPTDYYDEQLPSEETTDTTVEDDATAEEDATPGYITIQQLDDLIFYHDFLSLDVMLDLAIVEYGAPGYVTIQRLDDFMYYYNLLFEYAAAEYVAIYHDTFGYVTFERAAFSPATFESHDVPTEITSVAATIYYLHELQARANPQTSNQNTFVIIVASTVVVFVSIIVAYLMRCMLVKEAVLSRKNALRKRKLWMIVNGIFDSDK